MNISKLQTIFFALLITTMAVSMILLPKQSLEASVRGLNMWWEIVFPSLFPFFVISELLIGFGVVTLMGVMLEPLMRPLFKVPGVGGFAWAMGMATGFPAGAKLTARLRQERQLTRVEAERLVSFTNSSSPLFIFGAVSVGFFNNPRLGFILACTHYLGNFCVGIVMRFYGKEMSEKKKENTSSKPLIWQALAAMHRKRLENKKPIGKLIGDAVVTSIHTLLMIGGFIILFSVINKLLYHLQITFVLANTIEYMFILFHLPSALSIPLIAGLFEITLGSQMTSSVNEASLLEQVMMVSFILGFSGFSVQAQVASILAQTDIRFKPFFLARILHGFLAAIFTLILWKPFTERFHFSADSWAVPAMLQGYDAWWESIVRIIVYLGPLFTLAMLLLYTVLIARRMRSSG